MSFNDIPLGNDHGSPGRDTSKVLESDSEGIERPPVHKQHGGSTGSSKERTPNFGSEAKRGTEGGWTKNQAEDEEFKMDTKEEAKGIRASLLFTLVLSYKFIFP